MGRGGANLNENDRTQRGVHAGVISSYGLELLPKQIVLVADNNIF